MDFKSLDYLMTDPLIRKITLISNDNQMKVIRALDEVKHRFLPVTFTGDAFKRFQHYPSNEFMETTNYFFASRDTRTDRRGKEESLKDYSRTFNDIAANV